MKAPLTGVLVIALSGAVLIGCSAEKAPPPAAQNQAEQAAGESAPAASLRLAAMADAHSAVLLQGDPVKATELGVPASIAGEGSLSSLGRFDEAFDQELREQNAAFIADLRAIPREDLSADDLVTYDVLDSAYQLAARRNEFGFGGASAAGASVPSAGASWVVSPYAVTQLTGPHLRLPRLLLTQHPVTSEENALAYIARLNDFNRAFADIAATLERDAQGGVVPPRFALLGTIAGVQKFIEPAPAEHPLANRFRQALGELKEVDADRRAELELAANDAIQQSVYPAYQALLGALQSLVERTDDEAGVWRLGAVGEEFYQLALDAYGGAGMSGEDVHQLGLAEVDRITSEMDAILKGLGLAEGAVADRMVEIGESDGSIYPNTDEGREALLESLRGQVAEIMRIAPSWFGTLPPQPVEVRRIPEYEQDSSPGGYYSGPSLDGTRPGIYWINLKNTADNPKHSLPTLTYHEAVPGHHFQISFQRAIEDMPLIRNTLGYSEYTEGWALYAEALAKEMGMYASDPHGDLGRLQAELFRAARLVVDSGIHFRRWSRDEAIDYMVDATGETRASITREVERYSVVPGQATSYKLGMIRIQALRAKAEAALGDQFDIRAFHDAVLESGAVPLPVLEAKIDRWIEAQKRR